MNHSRPRLPDPAHALQNREAAAPSIAYYPAYHLEEEGMSTLVKD